MPCPACQQPVEVPPETSQSRPSRALALISDLAQFTMRVAVAVSWTNFYAAALLVATGCGEIQVTIDGPGRVIGGKINCPGQCLQPSADTTLTAIPDDGASFVGWSGACGGSFECTIRSGSATAHFRPLGVVRVRIYGLGEVVASDGRRCTDACDWQTNEPIDLVAVAGDLHQFDTFSGSCTGLSCTVSSGMVTATFEPIIRTVITGSGAGVVQVDGEACTASCDVRVSGPVVVRATADSSSFEPEITGDCALNPCIVSAPARVLVKFTKGRSVDVRVSGPGKGHVEINGSSCLLPSCHWVVSTEAPVLVSAVTDDPYDAFAGFDGGGCGGASTCTVVAGADPLMLEAAFSSRFLWSREIDGDGQALLADDDGLVVALRAPSPFVIDGQTFPTQLGAAPFMGAVVAFEWDGGVRWVRALNAHAAADTNQDPHFRSIARQPNGDVVVVGSCAQGRLNGMATCAARSSPLVIRINSAGGLESVVTHDTITGAEYAVVIQLPSSLVSYLNPGLDPQQGLLGVLSVDGGFEPRVVLPSPGSTLFRPICSAGQQRLFCVFDEDSPVTVDACALPAGGLDTTFFEFDDELRCLRAARMDNAGGRVGGPSTARDGGVFVFGLSGPATFGPGLQTTATGAWLAGWDNGFTRVGLYPQASLGGLPLYSEEIGAGILTQTKVTPYVGFPERLYGESIADGSIVFTFVDRADLASPLLRFAFEDDNHPLMLTIESTRFFVVGDALAVFVTGTNVRFGTRRLSSDGIRKSHLVVLKVSDLNR